MKQYPQLKKVLKLLAAGTLLSAAIIAPNTAKVSHKYIRKLLNDDWQEYDGYELKKSIIRLKRKGFIEVAETMDGPIVKISQKGIKMILKYDLETMKIIKQAKWDEIWRIIIFDIPEKKKGNRDVFRSKLVELGFIQVQKSVFVYPYPCDKEVSYLREIFEIGDNVLYIKAKSIEDDGKLRKVFKL